MKKLKNWINNYQIAAFYVISFAISWGLGFSYPIVLKQEQVWLLPLVFLAICGPGLAGIIISAITNTEPRMGTRKAFWIALMAAWIVTTCVFLANSHFIENLQLSPLLVGIFTISVLPVAFIIASAYSRIPAVKNHMSSIIRVRGVAGWSLLALVLFPALFLVSIPVSRLLNKQTFTSDQFPEVSLSLIGLVAVKFLYQFFFFNATAEESAWRGFALPRFQAKTNPLLAALVIGFFWTLFHLPYWQAEGRPVSAVDFWVEMFVGHLLLSVTIVWLCNRAKGSILVAGIAHAALNTVQEFVPIGNSLFLVLLIPALVVILVDKMWEKLPADHPAVYKTPQQIEGNFDVTRQVKEKTAV